MDGTLTGTTVQNEPESNVNEGVLYTPYISRNEASPSDAVQYHKLDPPTQFWGVGGYSSAEIQSSYSKPCRQGKP